MAKFTEYRVRRVERWIVTRFDGGDGTPGISRQIGNEYVSAETAYEVAYALARADHERHGWLPGDDRIRYPEHPQWGVSAESPAVEPDAVAAAQTSGESFRKAVDGDSPRARLS